VSLGNVELSRKAVDAWNRRDVRGFVSYLDPNVEMLPTGGVAVHTPVFHGRDEVTAWFTETLEQWDVLELTESETRDLRDSTLWLGRFRVRAAASGVELDQEWAMHGVWAGGKMVRLNTFRSWIDALQALGLEK
jgi:ketosteroid isomerase-like protein